MFSSQKSNILRFLCRRKTSLRYKGWRKLALRKLLSPILQYPVKLTTPEGLRFCLSSDPEDELEVIRLIRNPDLHYPDLPPEIPQKHLTILEIGSHHGFTALYALHKYPDSTIICVEPSPTGTKLIHQNLELNGWNTRAEVICAALAAQGGTGVLRSNGKGSLSKSLYHSTETTQSVEEIPLKTLDEILGQRKPDIIKCNAEGAEYTLIEQLRALDLIQPLLIVAMTHPEFGNAGQLVLDTEALGYRLIETGTSKRPTFHFWRKDLPVPLTNTAEDCIRA